MDVTSKITSNFGCLPSPAFIDFLDVGGSGTMTISQEIANLTEDSRQDLPEENVLIGSIQGTVVGLRYYTGTVGISHRHTHTHTHTHTDRHR